MIETVLCKSCVQYRPKEGSVRRINANGARQVRCAACIEKAKEAQKAK